MEFFGTVLDWFANPANLFGADGIQGRLGEHMILSVTPLAIAMTVALPVGAWIGHTGRAANLVINIANIGRAIPSLAILAMATMLLQAFIVSIGLRQFASEIATMIALTALAIPPILTNAYVGINEVDDDLVEAGRGMGMRETQILRKIEVPVALPVILVGVRTAAVQVVATATLGAVFATGGLGRFIIDGIAQRRYDEVFAGALVVAILSILIELFFEIVQRRITSPGLRGRRTASQQPSQAGRGSGA